METFMIEEASLVSDYQREDDLADLWLELARDLIDHARITRAWLGFEAQGADPSPISSGAGTRTTCGSHC
jgi:hypothetical protein